jgi:hypothetical protein
MALCPNCRRSNSAGDVSSKGSSMWRELRTKPELARECKLRGISVEGWVIHFGFGMPGEVTCEECQAFLAEDCEGGGDPVVCIKRDYPRY